MAPHPIQELIQRIDQYRDAMIDMQRALCQIPALAPENDGDGEVKKADWLLEHIRNWGFDRIDLIKAPDARVSAGYRPNIVAMLNGRRADRTLWIMSHLDVVPPGDLRKWTGDPWELRIEGDRLIGRGTEDNQQGLVSSLYAAKAFLDLQIQPELSIGLLIVADEETGSQYGVQYLLNHHPELFRPDDYFIIPDAGTPDGAMIEIAEKSILWLKFEVRGVQTHGSTPQEGKNAHKAGAELIVRLDELYQRFSAQDPVFDPPISTFEPTKKEANVPNINTIPGEDVFYFDCRILPQYDLAEVWQFVRDTASAVEAKHGVRVQISSPQEEAAAPPTPADAPVVQAIRRAMQELRGVECRPMGIGGGTVAAYFRHAGFPAAVWATIADVAHEPDEYCLISNMVEDAKVFAHIALQKA